MLKPVDPSVALPQQAVQQPPIPIEAVKNVFRVLHGCYGNLVFSKFATGDVDRGTGEDRGLVSAQKVWAHGLREFEATTIKAALGRCMERHPEYPPSLAQFIALCHACKPRNPWKQQTGPTALPISPELAAKYRAEFRAKLRQAAEEIRARREHVGGLDSLKQCIARAVADAGGDEVATLMRLDRMLSPKVPA
jgi:hypothetical protein